MDHGLARIQAADIEAALCRVAGIEAARVVVDGEGVVTELHVLALPHKQPKQLVRDIESTLMARFGLPIDHRKISIAQLDRPAETLTPIEPMFMTPPRLRIVGVNAASVGLIASASVTLELGGEEYFGKSSGAASSSGRLRQPALAALDALSGYLGEGSALALEDVSMAQLGKERVAVVCVSLVTGIGESTYSGTAIIRTNESDAVVRATLDALNRRLALNKPE